LLLISFFTALARCVEIILKPVIAHWSDNSDFEMGRRKPFMLFGCGFYALFLILIFAPSPSFTPITTSIWFGIFYVFFFIADTVCNIPYQALGPEMSRDTNEREKMYMVFYFFQYIGVLFVSAAPVIIQKFLPSCACKQCDIPTVIDKSSCVFDCNLECSSKKDEQSLLYMTIFMGTFFVCSIILLSMQIKEKREYLNKEKIHLVPTLFRLFSNQPFIKVLLPWIIDATAVQIFATMLPFYLSYIINPQKYCKKNKIDSSSSVCNSTHWIGITIFVFFTFCIVFTFIWHWLVQFIGKKKSWQACSLISILTFSLFLICEEGSMVLMTILSAINSFPAGGGYLTDVFVSDVIDYDEFITGSRNEGIYIVFSTFTPKIVGIFAQSIPLTVLSCKTIFKNFNISF
jgi:glycoside/pentoside/hexuronide:cation symporter, GPH family